MPGEVREGFGADSLVQFAGPAARVTRSEHQHDQGSCAHDHHDRPARRWRYQVAFEQRGWLASSHPFIRVRLF